MIECAKNTDRELWRAREGDHYAPSVHVTEAGYIGMSSGGRVHVMAVADWVEVARQFVSAIDPEITGMGNVLNDIQKKLEQTESKLAEYKRTEPLKIKERNKLAAELAKHQESEFHPDWSLLESTREALKELTKERNGLHGKNNALVLANESLAKGLARMEREV